MPGDSLGTARVAVAQLAPVFLDREASADKVVALIERAGQEGAQLVGFPEGVIPAHPVWYHFHPVTGKASLAMAAELFANSVEVPGPTIDRLCKAAAAADVAVVVGVCEKRPGTTGTMFNSQVFIGRDGAITGVHRKLMPTVGERIVHAGGYGDTLSAFPSDLGPVSGLICGENSNPLATHALADLQATVHVASWPNHFSPNEQPMQEVALLASRSLAYRNGCFVLNACGIVSPDMVDRVAFRPEDRAFLEDPANGGGSCIVDPGGHVVAGPMPGDQEGILVADVDLDECVRAKIVHDYAGHYNRADVFTLSISESTPTLVQRGTPTAPATTTAARSEAAAASDQSTDPGEE
jgi:nitrilase